MDRCIAVGGRVHAHFVSDFEGVKEEAGLTVKNLLALRGWQPEDQVCRARQ